MMLLIEFSLLSTVAGAIGSFFLMILSSPLLVKAYERRQETRARHQQTASDIGQSHAEELREIHREVMQEVKILRDAKIILATEKLELDHKIFLLSQQLKEERRFASEQNDEILLKIAEIGRLEDEIKRLKQAMDLFRKE